MNLTIHLESLCHHNQESKEGLGYSSVVERLLSMYRNLAWIPSTMHTQFLKVVNISVKIKDKMFTTHSSYKICIALMWKDFLFKYFYYFPMCMYVFINVNGDFYYYFTICMCVLIHVKERAHTISWVRKSKGILEYKSSLSTLFEVVSLLVTASQTRLAGSQILEFFCVYTLYTQFLKGSKHISITPTERRLFFFTIS